MLTKVESRIAVWSDRSNYSRNASQGSGLGDNIFEFDGAKTLTHNQEPVLQSITLPRLRTPNPVRHDHWRDNVSVQFRNNIFIGKETNPFKAMTETTFGIWS